MFRMKIWEMLGTVVCFSLHLSPVVVVVVVVVCKNILCWEMHQPAKSWPKTLDK